METQDMSMDLDEQPRIVKISKKHHRRPASKVVQRQEEFSDEEVVAHNKPVVSMREMDEEAEEEDDEEEAEPRTESLHEMDDEPSSTSIGAVRLGAAAATTFPTTPNGPHEGATNGLLFNDDELFSLDDNLVRRIIYAPCREAKPQHCHGASHIVALNFTKQCFEPGATKLYHLKDHYYELFCSVFNALAFATGKKVKLTPSEKVVREKPQPRRRGQKDSDGDADDDMAAVAASVEKTPEIEVNNFLQGNKDISVFIETLVTGNKVSGFRFWIFDRASSKTNNDTVSLGLRESLLEAAKIQEQANRQMQLIIKNNGSAKSAKAKKAAASKQYALAKEFSFSTYASFDRHFTGLISRYFSKDSCLAVSANTSTVGKAATRRQFRDTRAYTTFDTVKQQEVSDGAQDRMDYTKVGHPCNFSKLFGKEAAMFYYVNEESINESQCRLESYFANASGGRIAHAKESAHCRANFGSNKNAAATAAVAATMVDVADYVGSASDKEFTQFPYESITYHIHNTFVSHEFMGRMPLPHRMGSTLYTQKDLVELKKGMGLAINPTEDAEADTELVDGDEIDDFLNRLAFTEQSDAEASVFTRNQRNATAADKQHRLNYGAVVRYMGLHHTEMELTTDILLSQLHHVDAAAQAYLKMAVVPRDILDKFLANKRNEINSRLRLIITNIGHKHRMVVTETLTAAINTQEDTRRKSLSAASLLSSKAGSDERDQTVNIMDQIGHNSHVDESDANLLQLPYVSLTVSGILNNTCKTLPIKRKAFEYVRRRTGGEDEDEDGYALDPEARVAQLLHENKEYQSKLASGKVAYYKDIIEKYRPYGNSLYTIRSQLHQTEVEEVYLGRDIFLRLAELNTVAYANLDLAFFDPITGQLPADREYAYLTERRQLRDALTVECWHEFFENRSVSLACDGIRSDLLKQKITYAPPESCGGVSTGLSTDQITGRRMIGTVLPVHDYKQELRPFGEFKTWVQSLFADQFGIAYNYKIMWILYIARLHHCRWLVDCNSPKHNVILSGTGMAGKSHLLQSIKKILPTGVGDMVTHITDQAFNVDRNMNDMLLIYEEFQNKYLGYSQGGGGGKNGSDGGGSGGVSAGGDKDTTNFFKARLTSGATTTMSWFENEETGMRDMKISKAHCQGSMMGASNNDFTYADANVMSRFILLSVPKSKAQHEGNRPQDKHKYQFGTDSTQNKAIYEQHKEIHRVYFLVEQMVKSNVLGENEYGVNVDGGRIMRDLILDHLQKRYGISTGDVRKRDHILEMMRSMALSCAVWIGLTSVLTRDLQYDPHDPNKFIGFNPRVITEGIFPFMVVTKDMVFDAITALSSLWYHDYQDLIVEVFATKQCQLQELRESDFLVRPKDDNNLYLNSSGGSGGAAAKRGGGVNARLTLTASNNAITNVYGNAYGGGGGANMLQAETETDYNYIVMKDKSLPEIYQVLSTSLGDMVVAPNDIGKLFNDLSKCRLDNCDSYEMKQVAMEYDEESGAVTKYRNRLVRGLARKSAPRPIVEFIRCATGKHMVALLVHFVKQKLPGIFTDDLIEDLNKNERRVRRATELQDVVLMQDGNMEMQVDENDYEERVRRIGLITEKEETLIIKSFKDVMENAVCEDMGMEAEEREGLEQCYANPSTGVVPWRVYITSDPPKSMLITDFYPELKDGLADTDDGDAPILFVDELKMFELKPKPQGRKIIIRNHNTVSPSTRATLSIHKETDQQLVKRRRDDGSTVTELGPGEVLKKHRIKEYSRIEAWELDADIDKIFCDEHLRNIAFNGLPSKPECETINYPPFTYMAIMEDKMKQNVPLFEYPFVNNMVRIANRKKHAQGLINPDSVKYPKLRPYLVSNFSENSVTRQKACGTNKTLAVAKPIQKRCYATEKKNRQNLMEQLLFPDY